MPALPRCHMRQQPSVRAEMTFVVNALRPPEPQERDEEGG